jgi:hypothetical protein
MNEKRKLAERFAGQNSPFTFVSRAEIELRDEIVAALRAEAQEPARLSAESEQPYGWHAAANGLFSTDPRCAEVWRHNMGLNVTPVYSRPVRTEPQTSQSQELPSIPDDDNDFTPDLARNIIAKYQNLLSAETSRADENSRSLHETMSRIVHIRELSEQIIEMRWLLEPQCQADNAGYQPYTMEEAEPHIEAPYEDDAPLSRPQRQDGK